MTMAYHFFAIVAEGASNQIFETKFGAQGPEVRSPMLFMIFDFELFDSPRPSVLILLT